MLSWLKPTTNWWEKEDMSDSFCSTFTKKPMNQNELKIAEEWVGKDFSLLINCSPEQMKKATKHYEQFINFIKQIQLNAYRAAMTKAAEITKQGDGYEHKAGYWSEKILVERDKNEVV